jgi:predicted transcriptional regulator of viral defense system
MLKKNYLTPDEQILYSAISTTEITDHDTIHDLFPTYTLQKINKLTHSLISKGYLYPLKRGSYLVNPRPSKQPIINNPFTIAPYITKGYLGFSSALRLYDLLDYEPFTIFIVTKEKSQHTTIGNYVYQTIAMGRKATGATYYKNLYISTLEKTIFDCFYKPQYAGGYPEIVKALLHIDHLDWTKVRYYFQSFASDSLYQRTGYILDLLQKEKQVHIPKTLIHEFQRHARTMTRLVPSRSSHGVYHNQWKLLDNVGTQTLFPR